MRYIADAGLAGIVGRVAGNRPLGEDIERVLGMLPGGRLALAGDR